jgi:nucleoside 2-deoxyribosyltransferase
MKIYLAGPDVFLPNPLEIAAKKKAICIKYGFTGVFPMDTQLDFAGLTLYQKGMLIYCSDKKLMNECDLIVANMTPFRGPSMDIGTGFELGYMAGQNKPLFAYSNDGRLYVKRVTQPAPGLDESGMSIESFNCFDNLMIDGAICHSGGDLIVGNAPWGQYYTDVSLFEKVVKIAAEKLLKK